MILVIPVYLFFEGKTLLEKQIERRLNYLTSLDVAITGMTVERADLYGSEIHIKIKRIRLKNPKTFIIPNLALVVNIDMTVKTWPLFRGRWEISRLRFFIKRAAVQINKRGDINLRKIPALIKPDAVRKANFEARQVTIRMGRIYYLDFSRTPPERFVHNFKAETRSFEYVRDPADLFLIPLSLISKEFRRGNWGLTFEELPPGVPEEPATSKVLSSTL